jgi:hypothetical protein
MCQTPWPQLFEPTRSHAAHPHFGQLKNRIDDNSVSNKAGSVPRAASSNEA